MWGEFSTRTATSLDNWQLAGWSSRVNWTHASSWIRESGHVLSRNYSLVHALSLGTSSLPELDLHSLSDSQPGEGVKDNVITCKRNNEETLLNCEKGKNKRSRSLLCILEIISLPFCIRVKIDYKNEPTRLPIYYELLRNDFVFLNIKENGKRGSIDLIFDQLMGTGRNKRWTGLTINQAGPGFCSELYERGNTRIRLPLHVRGSTYGSAPTSGSENVVCRPYGPVYAVHCLPWHVTLRLFLSRKSGLLFHSSWKQERERKNQRFQRCLEETKFTLGREIFENFSTLGGKPRDTNLSKF